MGSENSNVIVTLPTTQVQDIIFLPIWLTPLATMSIRQVLHKVTLQYNLTMHQLTNLIPSIDSVLSPAASSSKCMPER